MSICFSTYFYYTTTCSCSHVWGRWIPFWKPMLQKEIIRLFQFILVTCTLNVERENFWSRIIAPKNCNVSRCTDKMSGSFLQLNSIYQFHVAPESKHSLFRWSRKVFTSLMFCCTQSLVINNTRGFCWIAFLLEVKNTLYQRTLHALVLCHCLPLRE